MFLASLVDLPNITEAQRTLDHKTFYKSVDVAQIMFVHSKSIEDISIKQPHDLVKFAKDFNAVTDDQEFYNCLYRKSETLKKVSDQLLKGEEVNFTDLKFRHGLCPSTKNIRNYGFADNVEEELLEFDEVGNLVNTIKGAKEKIKDTSNVIKLNAFFGGGGDDIAESSIVDESQHYDYDQSSIYTHSVANDEARSYRPDTIYNYKFLNSYAITSSINKYSIAIDDAFNSDESSTNLFKINKD